MTRFTIEVEENVRHIDAKSIISALEDVINQRNYTLYDSNYETEEEDDED